MSGADPSLRPDQFDRYRRHLSLPELGFEGQKRLLESSVLLIGVGGLGCPLAQYLAAAGVGHLGLVDHDVVDASNLQRQILYDTACLGQPKVEAARRRLQALNPDIEVSTHRLRLGSENTLELFEPYDVIVDGTDNFPTRYLCNDACVLLGKPNVYGSVLRFEGHASVFDTRVGPCYRCLYPEPPPHGSVPSCAEGGVLGVLPGIIAMIQATETVKLLTGIGETLAGRLLLYDALAMEFSQFRLHRDPECPLCGEHPSVTELVDYAGFCGVPGAADTPGAGGGGVPEISAFELNARRQRGEELLLLDVRSSDEFERAHIEGSTLIPVSELGCRLAEIDAWKQRPVVVLCHHGPRGERAGALLLARGFARVENVTGGIEAWSLTVDSSVPRY